MNKIKVKRLFVDITTRCNMKCPHCMNGDVDPQEMTGETMDFLLKQIESIDHLYLSGGEISLCPEVCELFLEKLKMRKISVNKIRFYTNGMLKSIELLRVFGIYQSYVNEPDKGKLIISNDCFHFLDIKSVLNPMVEKLLDSYSEPLRSEMLKNRSLYEKRLVFNNDRYELHTAIYKWYREKLGSIIILRDQCNEEIVLCGNAKKNKSLIRAYAPKIEMTQRVTNSFVELGSNHEIEVLSIDVNGLFYLADYVMYNSDISPIGNVRNGILSCIEKYNEIPKIKYYGRFSCLMANMYNDCAKIGVFSVASAKVIYSKYYQEISDILPEAEKYAETKTEIMLLKNAKKLMRTISQIAPSL